MSNKSSIKEHLRVEIIASAAKFNTSFNEIINNIHESFNKANVGFTYPKNVKNAIIELENKFDFVYNKKGSGSFKHHIIKLFYGEKVKLKITCTIELDTTGAFLNKISEFPELVILNNSFVNVNNKNKKLIEYKILNVKDKNNDE